jgi:hypothetical protein
VHTLTRTLAAAAVTALLVAPTSLPTAAAVQQLGVDKVLVVGMDGLRADRIPAAAAPNLDRMTTDGTLATSLLYTSPMAQTLSGPGWSTIATGTWPDRHGVKDNTFAGKNYGANPDFLTRLERIDPAYSTLAIADWAALIDQGTFSTSVDARVRFDGDRLGYRAQDALVRDEAVRRLRDTNPDASFVYFGETDEAGHSSGAASQAYLDAIARQDAYLGQLLSTIRERPAFPRERWTVIVTTDHGHTDAGGHGGSTLPERQTFVLATGPGIAAGARPTDTRLVDVAATVLGQLGVTSPGLDGAAIQRRSTDPFERVTLGPRVDETGIPASISGFTHAPPPGWTADASKLPTGGVTEWRGWSFTTDPFWTSAQRDQWRELNVRSRGVFAVADSDEWDDKSHGSGNYDATLTSAPYPVSGGSATLRYNTHYHQEGNQKAQVLVSFDGGPDTLVKTYSADAVARAEAVSLTVPAGATSARVKFRYFDAVNNWYWAIDDVRIN